MKRKIPKPSRSAVKAGSKAAGVHIVKGAKVTTLEHGKRTMRGVVWPIGKSFRHGVLTAVAVQAHVYVRDKNNKKKPKKKT